MCSILQQKQIEMKHLLLPSAALLFLLVPIDELNAQVPPAIGMELRVSEDSTKLEIYMQSPGMTYGGAVNQFGYAIKWPAGSGAMLGAQDLPCPVAIPIQQYATLQNDGYFYTQFVSISAYALNDPSACPDQIWLADQWVLVHQLEVDDPSGNFAFEIATDEFALNNNMVPFLLLMGVEFCEPMYGCQAPLVLGDVDQLAGHVFLDVDNDGLLNGADLPIQNRTVSVGQGSYRSSGTNGEFAFYLPSGTYTVTSSPGSFDSQALPIPVVQFVDELNENMDVPLPMVAPQIQTDLGISVETSPPVPGFENLICINYKNHGATLAGGTVSFSFPDEQEFLMDWPAGTVSGNTITWTIDDLQLGETGYVSIVLITPETIPLGTEYEYVSSITSAIPDDLPSNDQVVTNVTVVGSYDPNDKLVSPSSLTPAEVADGKHVTYTIRFQNTGTYPAQNVRIEDDLPADLDVSTFEFLGSSHPCDWMISNGHLEFHFDGIMLPDSGSDLSGSQGHVMFRIAPSSDLQLGDAVENTAAIYFDFNEPVITEPAVFVVETNTGISDRNYDQLQIWPNPANDLLNVQLMDGAVISAIEIIDITGRSIRSESSTRSLERIDVSDLPIGNFVLRITSADGVHHGRFVKR